MLFEKKILFYQLVSYPWYWKLKDMIQHCDFIQFCLWSWHGNTIYVDSDHVAIGLLLRKKWRGTPILTNKGIMKISFFTCDKLVWNKDYVWNDGGFQYPRFLHVQYSLKRRPFERTRLSESEIEQHIMGLYQGRGQGGFRRLSPPMRKTIPPRICKLASDLNIFPNIIRFQKFKMLSVNSILQYIVQFHLLLVQWKPLNVGTG